MAAACSGELSNLAPTINTCPADTELVLFCNVAGQTGGYAFRSWGTIKQCLLTQGLGFGFLQFKVGQPGSPMNVGDDTLTISQANVIDGSVFVTLGGSELPQDDTSQFSYGPVVNPNSLVINFDAGVQSGYQIIIHYVYAK